MMKNNENGDANTKYLFFCYYFYMPSAVCFVAAAIMFVIHIFFFAAMAQSEEKNTETPMKEKNIISIVSFGESKRALASLFRIDT